MANQRKLIGRLPVFKGEWSSLETYNKLNEVTLYGSSFRSKIDGNTYKPAELNEEGTGMTVNENWYVVANGTDAYLAGEKIASIDGNTSTYNVSRFHQHTGFWEAVEYDESEPAYLEAQEYTAGNRVNLVNYTNHTFVAMKSMTGVMPDYNNISNKFTLEEAILFVPSKYRLTGMNVGFLDSSNKPVVHKHKGGTFTDVANWEEDVQTQLTELSSLSFSGIYYENSDLDNILDTGIYKRNIKTGAEYFSYAIVERAGDSIKQTRFDTKGSIDYREGTIADEVCTWNDWTSLFDINFDEKYKTQTTIFTGTFLQFSELDDIKIAGVYKRDTSKGAFASSIVLVTNDTTNNVVKQLRIDSDYTYFLYRTIDLSVEEPTWTAWEKYNADYYRKEILQQGIFPMFTKSEDVKYNLFNPDTATKGYFLNSSGGLTANANYITSDFIPFTKEMGKLIISVDGKKITTGGGNNILYDVNKQIIKAQTNDVWKGKIPWEEGVYFARLSISNTDGDIQVEVGDEVTGYIPYGLSVKNSRQLKSMLGQESFNLSNFNLNEGDIKTDDAFPYFLKKGLCMSFYADITTFDTIIIGKGYNQYRGQWVKIDNTNITCQFYESNLIDKTTVAHGLTIKTYIKVALFCDSSGVLYVIVQTDGGLFKTSVKNWGYECCYAVFVKSENSTLTNVKLTAGCTDFKKPVWAIGDSYFGVATNRWPGQIRNLGFFNFLLDGLAGLNSRDAYDELIRLLNYGTPKYLLWCLGMNDDDSLFKWKFDEVRKICESRNITMIAATIPTVPGRSKEIISQYVKDSGVRYIDFYKAVGATSEGTWYDGYLDDDGVHPTEIGAQALATQVLIDFPELMQYGIVSTDSEIGDITGDN